jgi:hydrogenase maturation factor
MTADPFGPACTCITCADEGIPLEVQAAPVDGLARCAGDAEVDVTLVEPVAPGDVVLVHAGVAIARVQA